MIITCDYCEKEINLEYPGHLDDPVFCSYECQGEWADMQTELMANSQE